MKREINVVGAVVTDGSKILSARRGEGMSLAGLWEFPGGKIESGETPREALAREMKEELLCDVRIGEQVTSTRHEYDFGFVTLTTFYAKLAGGEPELTEHAEIAWVEASALDSLDWAPADVPAVERIMADFAHEGAVK